MPSAARLALRVLAVCALYVVAIYAGMMAFGAAMSDGLADPVTHAPTKPYALMYGFAAGSFVCFTMAGTLWIGPLTSNANGVWIAMIGAIICVAATWAFLNLASFPAETERALDFPLFASLVVGPSLLVVGVVRFVRHAAQSRG